jgi:hypothetical protein
MYMVNAYSAFHDLSFFAFAQFLYHHAESFRTAPDAGVWGGTQYGTDISAGNATDCGCPWT